MKFKIFLVWLFIVVIAGVVYAFTNSLDGTPQDTAFPQGNNFSNKQSSPRQNNANQPFNPKEHTGFDHQDKSFPNPSVNDTRYNSNCQFGTCMPGGLNPNNR